MNWPELYLICFGVGSLWSVAALLMGGTHLGHHGGHGHFHFGHGHGVNGHAAHGSHGAHHSGPEAWLGMLLNPSCIAIFLAWFGGVGYLLTRHSSFGLWVDIALAGSVGLAGAVGLAAFLRWLQSHEAPIDPANTDLTGVMGKVSSTVRQDGVGEMIYTAEGVRRGLSVRSEDGQEIARGTEVVVVRFEKGIAFVRTWEAMTQPSELQSLLGKPAKGEQFHVE